VFSVLCFVCVCVYVCMYLMCVLNVCKERREKSYETITYSLNFVDFSGMRTLIKMTRKFVA
jgi:hypothetical protein